MDILLAACFSVLSALAGLFLLFSDLQKKAGCNRALQWFAIITLSGSIVLQVWLITGHDVQFPNHLEERPATVYAAITLAVFEPSNCVM
ncbi:MAG: hypothetical protein P4M05_21115 [Bradyrhizobium sp.]|nr:hypothetical protein [Bradyrhizobium sp.]